MQQKINALLFSLPVVLPGAQPVTGLRLVELVLTYRLEGAEIAQKVVLDAGQLAVQAQNDVRLEELIAKMLGFCLADFENHREQ